MHNIMILGSGGREHAFAWKIKQSAKCGSLFVCPGNGGTAKIATNLAIGVSDFAAIKAACVEHSIDILLVGPEIPLVEGVYDYMEVELPELAVIGPSKTASQLEGSKAYAKEFMIENNIPTAGAFTVTVDRMEAGIAHLQSYPGPYVLKADGLAAGKGVLIIQDQAEAITALKEMLDGQFGHASSTVVIEDFLDGIEFSVFVLTDGKNYKVLPVAKDYKRIGENDQGLNTGGMGSVSPVSFVSESLMEEVIRSIIEPTMQGIQNRKLTYKGFVFLGLISVDNKPYVIEYNCRMGDPETEVVLPRIKNDFIELLSATADGSLDKVTIEEDPRYCTSVFLVSGGYPEKYEKNKEITSLEKVKDSIIFHAGTREDQGKIVTNGGRVIAVSSLGANKVEALALSMRNADIIDFENKYYRKDIGFDIN